MSHFRAARLCLAVTTVVTAAMLSVYLLASSLLTQVFIVGAVAGVILSDLSPGTPSRIRRRLM